MKTILFSPALLLALLSLTSPSCSKKSSTGEPTPTASPTGLKITFSQGATPTAGATVSLYDSQNAWALEVGAVATATSDAQGQVTFTGLRAQRYWWLGKSGCLNNNNSTTSTALAITAGQTSSVSATMASTGTLKMVNTSTNPYRVWVDGVLYGDQQGGTTVTYKYEPTGTRTVRVLQLSGYAVTPTERTLQGTLICNGTLTATFP